LQIGGELGLGPLVSAPPTLRDVERVDVGRGADVARHTKDEAARAGTRTLWPQVAREDLREPSSPALELAAAC